MPSTLTPAAILAWHIDCGADEAVDVAPQNRFDQPPVAQDMARPGSEAKQTVVGQTAATPPTGLALANERDATSGALARAEAAETLEQLCQTLSTFDECPLKHTATNLVFADGSPEADVMFIGEAPGAEEDRQGLPFVGVSGRLLDRMIGSIGLDRSSAYITNILPWRPPGNRKPTPAETTMCLPFIHRHIELAAPKLLVFLGGTAAATLLERREGITKLRGRWLDYPNRTGTIPALPTYHPAFLLRQPALKRDSWSDFLAIKMRLEEVS